MKRILPIVLILTLLSVVVSAQEQPKKPGIAEWLKSLQQKIGQIVPKKTVPLTNGVAGVRGAKEDSQIKLYWKGKKGEEPVTEEETKKFQEAIDLAAKGDQPGAVKGLEEFLKLYPDSPLVPDAKKTIDLVKAEPQAAEVKKEEQKTEQQ